MDEAKKNGDAEQDPADRGDPAFPIRDFPDLRRLRRGYLKKGDKPIAVDSNDNPLPDDHEEDFGLTRSTREEAIDFMKRSLGEEECGDDPLTEFLDDQ